MITGVTTSQNWKKYNNKLLFLKLKKKHIGTSKYGALVL
jgi:hypothetical protein